MSTPIRSSSPTSIFKEILNTSLNRSASDIHLDSQVEGMVIRYRIDGILHDGPTIPKSLSPGMVSHIKVLANLDIAEKRRPQDGKTKFTHENRSIDIRISTIPTLHGEKIVLRILDPSSQQIGIDGLGLSTIQHNQLLQSLKQHQGIILATGPTGSGKTTTLYTMLKELNTREVNIVTVEDPIEYEIPGVNQTSVQRSIDYTFANALRAFLRQDPDIIFIGEIRDAETARIAIRAALTGHLVLSTIHTNNAIESVIRLVDMGVEPYLLAATLKLIIAQRLVRKLCTNCKGMIQSSSSCAKCNGTSYSGREGIFELLPITDQIQRCIHDGASLSTMKAIPEVKYMGTLEQNGRNKVEQGITTLEEVQRVINA